MKTLRMALMTCMVLATAACTYDSVRMGERHNCSAMPQSQAERCYSRTSMTKAEYDAERRKLAEAKSSGGEGKQPVDPRYEEWLP
jgi:hypothetical protein